MAATVSSTGGFEYQFVIPPQDMFVCKICHLPSRDPHLTICCGHVFCKSCLDGMKEVEAVVNNVCPMCRGEDFVTVPNKQIDREVKSLHVYCTNKGRGCEWQGEVNYIDNHLGSCEYEDVLCTSGCSRIIQRRDLTKHVETECPCRKVNCQYCQLGGECQFIEGKHKEDCVNFPLTCPNKCGEGGGCISRKDLHEHRSKCPLEVINCEYQTMGCEGRMTRQTRQEHNKEKMEYHLQLTKCKLDETNSELKKTKSELDKTNSRLDEANIKWDEANTKLDRTCSQLEKANFKLDETKKELSSTCLELTYLNVRFTAKFYSLETLINQLQWSTQLNSATQLTTGNKVIPVTFKMTGFEVKRKSKQRWLSDSFYTNTKGYRMCLQVEPNGDCNCKGTHCSMYLCLMRGQCDDSVSWPLRIKLQVTLLNQISDELHHSQIMAFSNAVHLRDVTQRVRDEEMAKSGWGVAGFISHELLTEVTSVCQFLRDDCIYVRISKP